jgi:hypothetical protein
MGPNGFAKVMLSRPEKKATAGWGLPVMNSLSAP